MGDIFLERLRAHDLVMYSVSCPLNPGQFRDIRGLGCYEVPGSATRVGWSESGGRTQVNRLGPNDLYGLW
jgi:hypothetical protein